MTAKRLVRAVRRVRKGAGRASGATGIVDLRGDTAQYRTRRELTAAEVEAVVARFGKGETMISIARDLEVDRRRVRKMLHERGATQPPRRLTSMQVKCAADLYEAGSSLADVADRLGVSAGAVRNRLIAYGVRIRPGVGGRAAKSTHG